MNIKKDVVEALKKAIGQEYQRGNKLVRKAIDSSDHGDTVKGILADLMDNNSSPEIPSAAMPVQKDAVMTKTAIPNPVAEKHKMQTDQNKAQNGQAVLPKQPQGLGGNRPLKTFMNNRSDKLQKKIAENKISKPL